MQTDHNNHDQIRAALKSADVYGPKQELTIVGRSARERLHEATTSCDNVAAIVAAESQSQPQAQATHVMGRITVTETTQPVANASNTQENMVSQDQYAYPTPSYEPSAQTEQPTANSYDQYAYVRPDAIPEMSHSEYISAVTEPAESHPAAIQPQTDNSVGSVIPEHWSELEKQKARIIAARGNVEKATSNEFGLAA